MINPIKSCRYLYYSENNSSRLSTKMASYFSHSLCTLLYNVTLLLFLSRRHSSHQEELIFFTFWIWALANGTLKNVIQQRLEKCLNISISASLRTLSHQVNEMCLLKKITKRTPQPYPSQKLANQHTLQFSSVAQLCPTLCNPMNCSTPGLPVHHQLREFTQTHVHWVSDAIQPSHPLSSPSPPAPNPSEHQSLFQWVNPSHEVAKVLEFQL